MVNLNGGLAHFRRVHFQFAGVQVAREVREKRRGNLRADAVAFLEEVSRNRRQTTEEPAGRRRYLRRAKSQFTAATTATAMIIFK